MRAWLRAPQVCALSGATYRQLDYWSRTGALTAAIEARGSGTHRLYTESEAVAARVLVLLAQLGATGGVLGPVANAVALGQLHGVVVVQPTGQVLPFDALELAAHGWLVDVDAAKAYVRERLASLPSPVAA